MIGTLTLSRLISCRSNINLSHKYCNNSHTINPIISQHHINILFTGNYSLENSTGRAIYIFPQITIVFGEYLTDSLVFYILCACVSLCVYEKNKYLKPTFTLWAYNCHPESVAPY